MDNQKHKAFLEVPALKVVQPLGTFYVMKLKAKDLLSISFSEAMQYVDDQGNVKGSQRPKDDKRLKEIAKYIESVEMAFPNSIILAANYTQQGNISNDESERWKIDEDQQCGISRITIPKNIKLSAVIDGQHRLNAFDYVKNQERVDSLEIVCSVYFDLPNSYQAFLFATINSNQKKVDRSLALEQFGYNVSEEPEKAWTPEKFSVFLSRKLNIDKDISPLYQHIKVAPLHPENLFKDGRINTWVVSTATIVDGIANLISSNVKRDRIEMQQKSFLTGRDREMLSKISDYSPLRKLFIQGKDKTIYDTLINYFTFVNNLFWKNASDDSYIIKTVGLQATFDFLKLILNTEKSDSPETIDFNKYLIVATKFDFSDKFFQASGIGRNRIKNTLGIASKLIDKSKIKKMDVPFYDSILSGKKTETTKDKWIWEEDAENAVVNALDRAEWNYTSKTVKLFLDGGHEAIGEFKKYSDFKDKLIEIAEITFVNSLPSDSEFAEEQREKFDPKDIVNSYIVDYEENLKRLGWI